MKLPQPFYRLPLRFDAARMAEEISQFDESAWRSHPSSYAGNTALILVSSNGGQNDDMEGPMLPTEYLKACPYLQQVLLSFGTVIGRSRLMRLAPGANVHPHSDVNYYWRTHTRIHVPIVTDPAVRFTTHDRTVHMAAGEAWTFDNWHTHHVVNPSAVTRIHLVADTVGTSSFWNLLEQSAHTTLPERFVPYDPALQAQLVTETYQPAPIFSPGDLDQCLDDIKQDIAASDYPDREVIKGYLRLLDDLSHDWRALWMMHGPQESGWPRFQTLIARTRVRLAELPPTVCVASNEFLAPAVIDPVLNAACTTAVEGTARPVEASRPAAPNVVTPPKPAADFFDRPVFIIAAPRSGSTLLFETLAQHPDFFSLGDESHRQIEGIAALRPAAKNFASNCLTDVDATPAVADALRAAFFADLRDSKGQPYARMLAAQRPGRVRFLEKTPKNALRIPFLRAVFPDARFIYLYRNARDNISSLLDSWRSGRYVTYPELPDWRGPPWSHLLIPGWEKLRGAPLAEIVTQQWRITNQVILDALEKLPDANRCTVGYEALLKNPGAIAERLCAFAELPPDPRLAALTVQTLKPSRYTLTPPDPDKWRRNAAELETVLPALGDVDARWRALSV